jgi:hypothetical protein
MRHHIPGWTEHFTAELEALWQEARTGPAVWLPPSKLPQARPTRLERRTDRMREHTRTLLLNALRPDGTHGSLIQVQTCKAYRALPWEIGLRGQDSAVETPKPVTRADIEHAYFENVIDPIAAYVGKGLLNPDQFRVAYGVDCPETGAERIERMRIATFARPPDLSPDEPEFSFTEQHANPSLIGMAAKGAKPLTERQYFAWRLIFIASPLILGCLITGAYYLLH